MPPLPGHESRRAHTHRHRHASEEGWVKLNTDGSFLPENGTAGTCMILSDHGGAIIFSSCRSLCYCANALEEELMAIKEGFSLALQWSNIFLPTHRISTVNYINIIKYMGSLSSKYQYRESRPTALKLQIW